MASQPRIKICPGCGGVGKILQRQGTDKDGHPIERLVPCPRCGGHGTVWE